MKKPIISIITINYNNAKGLKKTIESIINQNCDKALFEYIVIDGGSADESIENIKSYEIFIDYWISEKDSGIYNAMNKGVQQANGKYCLFVNSGDCLNSKDTIQRIIKTKPDKDIVMGNVGVFTSDSLWEAPDEESLSLIYLRDNPLAHPAALIKTSLQKSLPYNETLRICADRQFFIEALIIRNCSYAKIPVTINTFAPAGASGIENDEIMKKEEELILQHYFQPRLMRDLNATNLTILQTTKKMIRYFRLTKILCRLNNALLDLVNFYHKK